MASDYLTVVPERMKVVEVIKGVDGNEVEYEFAVDPYGMAFSRRLGSTDEAEWLSCSRDIILVRKFLAGGEFLGDVLGKEWGVIIPPGGGTGRAYRTAQEAESALKN